MPENLENIPHTSQPEVQLIEGPSIYMERSGKGSRVFAEKLLALPEDPLSVEDADEAYTYEAKICDYQVGEDLSIEKLIKSRKSEAPRFFAEAFLQGRVQVAGLEGQLRQLKTSEEVFRWLAESARDETISPENFRELSRQSVSYYKEEVQQALLLEEEPDQRLLDVMSIAIEPKKVLAYAEAGQKARKYLRQQWSGLRVSSSNPEPVEGLRGAKRAFVDIYTKRVNGLVAEDYVVLQTLLNQAQLIQDMDTIDEIKDVLPPKIYDGISDISVRQRLNKRLDYIKNGIGYDKDGKASGVDYGIFEPPESKEDREKITPVFTEEEVERLKEVVLDKETIHAIYEAILSEKGMLSFEDESTWTPKRGHRAADDLFQVVYQPIKDTLAVDGIDGVVMTPNKERSILDMIVIGAHELEHINQSQADRALGKLLRIANIKGRRVSMFRETGANVVQRQLEYELTGSSKPVAYSYGLALQQLEQGGTIFDAAKAFYNDKLESEYVVGKVKAAELAADRTLRLGMRGNNSQPMSYAEENLMNRELADAPLEVRQRATQITTLDLDDQFRLHRYGLLPEVSNDSIDWTSAIMKHMQPYIEKALSD